jgi:hypothetical protein
MNSWATGLYLFIDHRHRHCARICVFCVSRLFTTEMRQDDRQPCKAGSLVGDSVHCGPLQTDGLFIRGGDSVAVETWGEVSDSSYLLLLEVIIGSFDLNVFRAVF